MYLGLRGVLAKQPLVQVVAEAWEAPLRELEGVEYFPSETMTLAQALPPAATPTAALATGAPVYTDVVG